MPESPPPAEDLLTLAQRLLIDPDDATPAETCRLARAALDFVSLKKEHERLQHDYGELSQTTELRSSHAILQKEFVELSESKAQTINRCSELLNENRRLHRIVFHPNQARSLAHALQIWAREVEAQAFAREVGLTDIHETEEEKK